MWVQRTADEMAEWDRRSGREARFHGLMIAGVIWVVVPIIALSGWFFSPRSGVAVQTNPSAQWWVRVVATVIVALPIGLYAYRRERRKELAKLMQQTICTTCEAMGGGDGGRDCACGGRMVELREVKWVKDAEGVRRPNEQCPNE